MGRQPDRWQQAARVVAGALVARCVSRRSGAGRRGQDDAGHRRGEMCRARLVPLHPGRRTARSLPRSGTPPSSHPRMVGNSRAFCLRRPASTGRDERQDETAPALHRPPADRSGGRVCSAIVTGIRCRSEEPRRERVHRAGAMCVGSVRSCRGCVGPRRLAGPGARRRRARPRPADPPGRRSCAGRGSESTARP